MARKSIFLVFSLNIFSNFEEVRRRSNIWNKFCKIFLNSIQCKVMIAY